MAMMNDHMPIATGAHYNIEHSPPSVRFNFQLSVELSTVKLLLLRSAISE